MRRLLLLIFQSWRRRPYILPKRPLIFNWIYSIISQRIELFITAAARSLSLTSYRMFHGRAAVLYQIRPGSILPSPLQLTGRTGMAHLSCNLCRRLTAFSLDFHGFLQFLSDKLKLNSVAWVYERNILTEKPPLIGEVSTNFCRQRVSRGQRQFLSDSVLNKATKISVCRSFSSNASIPPHIIRHCLILDDAMSRNYREWCPARSS
jgi:hypothetical protein